MRIHGPEGEVVQRDFAISASGLGFDSRPVRSNTVTPTTCHRCDVSSELCCPGAKPRHSLHAAV